MQYATFKLIIVLALACLLSACNSLSGLLFYPDQHYYRLPSDLGIDYSVVTIETTDGETLFHWLLKHEHNTKYQGTILFLHGNGENISTHMGSVAWMTLQGFDVLLFDYRGYGASSGDATLANALSDIELAHHWMQDHQQQPFFLFGQSMGGALALTYHAKTQNQPFGFRAVASESAPASWPGIAREVMSRHWLTWLLQAPASLITAAYDAQDHIGDITTPLLLMHSPEDPVVPYANLLRLMNNAPAQVQQVNTKGAHIAGLADATIRQSLVQFFNDSR